MMNALGLSAARAAALALSTAALLESPYVVKTPDGFSGLGLRYLRDLERVLNFKCSTIFEYDHEETKYKGFSGLTKYFSDCASNGDSSECMCDMAVSGFAMTAERLPRVDFAAPYAFDSFSAVQRVDEFRNANSGAFTLLFAPFAWNFQYLKVWAGVVYIVLSHVFGTRGHLAPTRQRILTLIAANVLAGGCLILCYEAGLVLQLFVDNPVSTFRSIEDVKSCRIDAIDFCVPSGGATQDYWTLVVRAARDNCRKQRSLEEDQPIFVTVEGGFKDLYSTGLSAVAERNCSYFVALLSTMAVTAENEYCDELSMVGDSFNPVPISFVLPKDSNITGPISTATIKSQPSYQIVCRRPWSTKLREMRNRNLSQQSDFEQSRQYL